MYTDKNKGNIIFLVILVISFISWSIFTASFLISNQKEIIHDKNLSVAVENEERLLEIIFYKFIKDIDREICEKNIKDIIYYFMEKDGALIWENNYETFVKTNRGFIISAIQINERTHEFSETSKNFRYNNYITNGILSNIRNSAVIRFYKEWKNIFIESENNIDDTQKYTIKMTGTILIDYGYKIPGEDKSMKTYRIEGLRFEIY